MLTVFDLYFASVAGFQYHPGAGSKGQVPLTIEQCAEVALRMLEVRRRIEEIAPWEFTWPDGQQPRQRQ